VEDTLGVTVRHGAADHLKFRDNIPPPLPAGKFQVEVPFELGVLMAVDSYDNVVDGANGATPYSGLKTVAYTLSGLSDAPDGSVTDAYTNFVSFLNGQSTTPLVTRLYRAQTTTITAHATKDLLGRTCPPTP